MTLHDVIVTIAAGSQPYSLGWFCVLDPLHATVNAQQRTIDAFKTLLDASDTPKMLERLESYKKLTDIAADAVREDLERRLSQEKDRGSKALAA